MLCFEMCVISGVLERADDTLLIDRSLSGVVQRVMARQEARFGESLRNFVRGTRFRPGGRAPYLHILHWLSNAENWSISLRDELALHPSERISVGQVVEKGYLAKLIEVQGLSNMLHYDPVTGVLSVEDPHLIFYLRNIDWPKFIRDAGFTGIEYDVEYDIALSFAGEDRDYAELLYNYLTDHDFAVFYDRAEQHRILAQNVELFLAPIYESGARYVVAALGETYGIKRWTLFESDRFKPRIEAGEVVPIWSTKIPPSAFDEIRKIGNLTFDPDGDVDQQAREAAEVIAKTLEDRDAISRSQ